jgi:hypothetical protein
MEDKVPIRGNPPEDMDNDDFVQYIEDQVAYMQGFLKLGAGKEVSFYELEEALKGYTHVHLSLLAMYNVARIEHMREEEEFNQWYAQKFVMVRAVHNLSEKTAQKWASQKELDCLLRSENLQEYKTKKTHLIETEQKYSFLGSLVKMWEGYSYTLSTLSTNIRAELGTSGMENRLRTN